MDQGPARRRLNERGVSSIQFVLAAAMALLLFLALANLVVVQYGRGAVRSALEQGARATSVSGEVTDCVDKARDVVGQLLGGRMSDRIAVSCSLEPGQVVARATAVFESWTILTPDFDVSLAARATLEWDP